MPAKAQAHFLGCAAMRSLHAFNKDSLCNILLAKVQGVTHLNPILVVLQWVTVDTLNPPQLHLADSHSEHT
jgi:hypothetical protein